MSSVQPSPPNLRMLGMISLDLPSGAVYTFRSNRVPALLGYLALNTGPQLREVIADVFWPEDDRESARHNLRQTLLYLRSALHPFDQDGILTTRSHIELRSEILPSDVSLLLNTERHLEFEEKRSLCERAVSLYGGPFLPGIDDEWVIEGRSRMAHLFVRALIFLADAAMDEDPAAALRYASQAVAEEPLQDGARARKIRALMRTGETAAAQIEYETFAELLDQELGMTPADIVTTALDESAGTPLLLAPKESDLGRDNVASALFALAAGDRPQQAVELAIALTPHWIDSGTPGMGLEFLKTALSRAGNRLANEEQQEARYCMALLAASRGDMNQAKQIVAKALDNETELPPTVKAKLQLLDAGLQLTDFKSRPSLDIGQATLEAAGPATDPAFRLDALAHVAAAGLYAGELNLALGYANQALELATELGEKMMIARCLVRKAQILEGLGLAEEAESGARRALVVIPETKNARAVGLKVDVARLLEDLGRLEEAEAGYREAISQLRDVDHFHLVVVLTYLGDILAATRRPAEAIAAHTEALERRRRLNQKLGIATSLRGLGRALTELGELGKARSALSESARLFLNEEAQPGYASVLLLLGQVEKASGNSSLAYRLGKRALDLLRGMSEWERRSNGRSGLTAIEDAERLVSECLKTG